MPARPASSDHGGGVFLSCAHPASAAQDVLPVTQILPQFITAAEGRAEDPAIAERRGPDRPQISAPTASGRPSGGTGPAPQDPYVTLAGPEYHFMRSSRYVSRLALTIVLFSGLAPERAVAETSFTRDLWTANRDVYDAILVHPFLKELQSGRLDRDAFAFYMMQDVSYLRAFGEALKAIAAKAPKPEWRTLLEQHAKDSLAAELQLHTSVFRDFGITADRVKRFEPAPEAFAYETFMLAAAHTQTFAEGLSALLPCYWIYLEVGKELKRGGSRDPTYQRWIDNYSSSDYEQTVQKVLAIVDEVAARASREERARMQQNFRRAARYEWMFWDSAYARRTWKP